MKVHRKILTHFLSCPSPIDKEGYLYKKKERTGVFRRRWFVLKGNLLFYQDRPADRHIQGAIVLEGCRVRADDSESDFSLVFQGLRTYRFSAADRHAQKEWLTCLATASHRYMSVLLRDLGLQYRAVTQSGGASSCSDVPSLPSPGSSGTLPLSPLPPPSSPSPSSSGGALRPRKSPKPWARRNAHVTPIRGPAPFSSEWPRVDFDPLTEFSKLHEVYGAEVRRARDAWLREQADALPHASWARSDGPAPPHVELYLTRNWTESFRERPLSAAKATALVSYGIKWRTKV
uniref:Sesquipedalian n=1 Tax=Neogobius melanostomus TaxID=47308 RepID=A0A8C6TI84_9GOBI